MPRRGFWRIAIAIALQEGEGSECNEGSELALELEVPTPAVAPQKGKGLRSDSLLRVMDRLLLDAWEDAEDIGVWEDPLAPHEMIV